MFINLHLPVPSGWIDDVPIIYYAHPEMPMHFELAQNYPNPVEEKTTISYSLPTHCDVDLMIYDLQGHRIAKLVDEVQSPGRKVVTWDSADYPSGAYVYNLSAGGKVFTKRMTVVR